MKKHIYFDLQLLENNEIANILSSEVIERETLHEWPLSCVEKITTTDQRQWVLKSNHEPCNLEGQFYQAVQHPNIIAPVLIQDKHPYQSIIYPYQDEVIPFSSVNLNKPKDALESFAELHKPIEEFAKPGLPAYLKMDDSEFLEKTLSQLIFKLTLLAKGDVFKNISLRHIKRLTDILDSPIVEEIALDQTGYMHGDFSGDNILASGTSYEWFILDWQRPFYGSILIDQYYFLKSYRLEPDLPTLLMGTIHEMIWFTDCAIKWFPDGKGGYEGNIHQLLKTLAETIEKLKH